MIVIDDLLAPTFHFWSKLACYSLGAISVDQEDIRKVINGVNKQQLVGDLKLLKAALVNSNKTIVVSSKLNNLFEKGVFIEFVDHTVKTIEFDL